MASADNLKQVLIIDDEADICLLLARKLQKKGLDATYATSLREGFSKFNATRPDFLILDHNLPDGYGLDNIDRFRKANPKVRIVVISAMINLGEAAYKAGADLFSPKPISFRDIEVFLGV